MFVLAKQIESNSNAFGIRGSSGEERGCFFVSLLWVGGLSFIVNHIVIVKGEVFILYSIESS